MATQPKYQIFISSTYEDLKDERGVIIRAVLEMAHIPVGMEMFSAADEEQWRIIQRHIDESDYYVIVIAHRYGSITEEGISYTRKEYEYAVQVGVPVLGFIIDPQASWPASKIDKEGTTKQLLDDFKALVRQKPVGEWATTADLYGRASVALMKAFTSSPRHGWIRATDVVGPEVTAELSRLSAENSVLRRQLTNAQADAETDRVRELQKLRRTLRQNTRTLSYRQTRVAPWEECKPQSLWTLYKLCASTLLTEVAIEDTIAWLAMNLKNDRDKPSDIVPINHVRDLFADFNALGLAEPSRKKHAVSDAKEYWTLTELGRSLWHYERRLWLEDVFEGTVNNAGENEADENEAQADPRAGGPAAKKAPARKAPAKKAPARKAAPSASVGRKPQAPPRGPGAT